LWILQSRRALDARADIHDRGSKEGDGGAHICNAQAAGDDQREIVRSAIAICGDFLPGEPCTGATGGDRGPPVEQDPVHGTDEGIEEIRELGGRTGSECLPDLPPLFGTQRRRIGGRLAAMELNDVERHQIRGAPKVVQRRVDEDPDAAEGELAEEGTRVFRRNRAPPSRSEDDAAEVCTRSGGDLRITPARQPADLDPDRRHHIPRPGCFRCPTRAPTAARRSGCRINDSPTSTASTPASPSRRTSSAVRIPLSATSVTPAGTRGARDSVRSRSVVKVRRSRLLMPI